MARTRIFGWDVGTLNAELSFTSGSVPDVVGSVSQEGTITNGSVGSLKLTPASGATGYWAGLTGAVNWIAGSRIRFYVRITSLPGTARKLLSCGASGASLRLNTDGTLTVLGSGSVLGSSTTALSDTARWYRIEFGSFSSTVVLRIDGIEEVNVGSAESVGARLGADDTVASTYTAYVDDLVVDDAAWPAHSFVRMLLPTGDTQVGSWTGGVGGTTNLFDAVNNAPPIGTATETDLTQIESIDGSGDNATDEYRATIATYASAGIVGGDTVLAVAPLIWHGEDVSTGTKTGSVAMVANPNPASYQAFTFGGDIGALGTFPSNWQGTGPALVDSPSVTLSTNPQIAVRKTDAGTRVASICFIGLKVEYRPAAGGATDTPFPFTGGGYYGGFAALRKLWQGWSRRQSGILVPQM